jgi:hypothetical protein
MSILCCILLLSPLIQPVEPASPSASTTPSLKTLLESYFRIPKTGDRVKAATDIAQSHHFRDIAAELPRLELWPSQQNPLGQPNGGEWKIALPSGQPVKVSFALPQEYDPSQPIPLIVVFPTQPMVTDRAPEPLLVGFPHAWVRLDKAVGGSFHQTVSETGDLPAVLREIRRHIHVDVDRVYLLGENAGADAGWIATMMYPNQFASVIAISGFPRIPYPEQSYALLLPNLRGTSFLSIWTDGGPTHVARARRQQGNR